MSLLMAGVSSPMLHVQSVQFVDCLLLSVFFIVFDKLGHVIFLSILVLWLVQVLPFVLLCGRLQRLAGPLSKFLPAAWLSNLYPLFHLY